MLKKQEKRIRRHRKIRSRISGTKKIPRLCVFRSNSHIYAQIVDDESGKTLVSASDLKVKGKKNKTLVAQEVGKDIAKKALEAKFGKIVFDRGGYKYHGRVKALAESARKEGLKF
ncbi:MAG: 50S ribosomal protein L18 [Candidatus Nealsonbacteria bacterium RIFOXYB1_FULL_40_15]|uniref:Large ribosomal subunit protein uL18 n=2 Tax=Candidatus Nealsoniibacteriota TaxID=1817911 RepID=A0A1G2EMU8_9BACT|nr:MAG: 50S ribosomal protein L18 [Candidatus Nealsonbacteria bacterium RIFOXYC1_FULL_40_7]OGZ27808.1 MAG: 50S ribosomal protein L18 [Candidatus Nealsonbacteria bacterium RIFOXYB1_FULL_40_15]OGZ28940.1 MAG: 50S ribosomal protein L18 [Candidatus Nealsonbacteria bacterium RIFOXYD1_FULL_39_11]